MAQRRRQVGRFGLVILVIVFLLVAGTTIKLLVQFKHDRDLAQADELVARTRSLARLSEVDGDNSGGIKITTMEPAKQTLGEDSGTTSGTGTGEMAEMAEPEQLEEIEPVEEEVEQTKQSDIDDNIDEDVAETETESVDAMSEYLANADYLHADFSGLSGINDEVKGWLQIAGTDVGYPFVQHANNEFYQKHTFNKQSNSLGWFFLDAQSHPGLSGMNSVFYARMHPESSIYREWRDILSSGWLSNRANFTVRTSSPVRDIIWRIFSVYHQTNIDDITATEFVDDEEYEAFLEKIIQKSEYNFQTQPKPNERILTITIECEQEKYLVLHAKIVKLHENS